MTMPNYIVNWEELIDLYIKELGKLGYNSIRDVQGVPKTKGFIKDVGKSKKSEEVVLDWEVDTSMVLTSLYYEQEYRDGSEYWEVYINGRKTFESTYVQHTGDTKHWKTIQALNKGDTLVIKRVAGNRDRETRVWIDVGYIDVMDYMNDFVVPPKPERPIDKGGKKK